MLRISFLNVNGLSPEKITPLVRLIDNEIDIIFLAETWNQSSAQLPLSKYYVHHHSGIPSQIGHARSGFAILARPHLQPSLTVIGSCEYSTTLRIGPDLKISCVYLPPSMSILDAQSHLENLPKPDVVLGDINVRFGSLFGDSHSGPRNRMTMITDWIPKFDLSHLSISGLCPRTDHVFANRLITGRCTQAPVSTDHHMITIDIPAQNTETQSHFNPSSSTWRFNLKLLNDDSNQAILAARYGNETENLFEQINDIANRLTQLSIEQRQEAIDKLDFLLMDSIQKATSHAVGMYRVSSKRKQRSFNITNDTSQTEAVKLFKHSCRPQTVRLISSNPDQSLKDNVKAHFETVYHTVTEENARSNFRFGTQLGLSSETIDNFAIGDIVYAQTAMNPEKVASFINNYNASKACGEDSIHTKILKCLVKRKSDLANHISCLFQLCACTGITPRRWNSSILYPLAKKPKANTIEQTRPIALSNMFRRIFEGCLLSYIEEYHHQTIKLHPTQAGFRRGHSTLMHSGLSHDLHYDMPGRNSFRTFIDFRQAYDRVPLERLFYKLRQRNLPIHVLSTITSLFAGCTTKPVINQKPHASIELHRGLFQGSILSPLLFNLFIDDLAVSLTSSETKVSALLYADDVQIMADSEAEMQQLLDIATNWVSVNRMEVNIAKCGYIANASVQLTLSNKIIPKVKDYQYLGFVQGPRGIKFKEYFARLALKASGTLKFCQLNGRHWPEWARLVIYKTFIRPCLEFGAPLLNAHYNEELKDSVLSPLSVIHKAALKWILPYSPSDSMVAIVTALPDVRTRFQALGCSFVEHMKRRDLTHPATLIILKPGPFALPLILLRAYRNPLHSTLWHQVTPKLCLKTIVKKWVLETICHHTRTGRAILPKSRCDRYGPDRCLFISDNTIRTSIISWRVNCLPKSLVCPLGHRFTKRCITDRHFDLNWPITPTILDCPNYCMVDYLINEKQYQEASSLLQQLMQKLESQTTTH